jgi:hypothetical protein
MSKGFAKQCCLEFDEAIKICYEEEFLRLPTSKDLQGICKLHKARHKVDGMFGSLDCTHTYWKNCPKAWQGSFHGKENRPSIVLEAICDYHLFFWHLSYGYAGTLNDLNIINMSPFHEQLLNGHFHKLENEAAVVPFKILEEEFHRLYVLVDGIYPQYSRFVQGVSQPVFESEKRFTAWQEGARKDIERAFGVLKACWQWLAAPIHLHDITAIANRARTCFILHNILVRDRVMGLDDLTIVYDAGYQIDEEIIVIDQPENLDEVQQNNIRGHDLLALREQLMPQGHPAAVIDVVTRNDRWRELQDIWEHARLRGALEQRFGGIIN